MKPWCLVIGLTVVSLHLAQGYKDRKILVSQFGGKSRITARQLEQTQQSLRQANLKNLYALPAGLKRQMLAQASEAQRTRWEPKLATDFMRFYRDGNRAEYSAKTDNHNIQLARLVVGQLLEQERNASSVKFLDQIVNGVWMLMEYSTWVIPPHVNALQETDRKATLPHPERDAIDLVASSYAAIVGWVRLMLADKFDSVSPTIKQRIDYELKRRIFQPYLKHDEWHWMGFQSRRANNWNVWINGDIFKTAMLTLHDADLFNSIANKTFYSVDYFLNTYDEDGGCVEGPAYWREAGGRLLDYIDSLSRVYNAKDYFKKIRLIHEIGSYVYKAHIDQNWFFNHGDSPARINYPPGLIFKYGTLYNNEKLKRFAAHMSQFQDLETIVDSFNEFWRVIETMPSIESRQPSTPNDPFYWLPDTQLLTAHSKSGVKPRTSIGVKFGNNGVSHGHLDIGNFVLFQEGEPVLIDIGAGTYTAKTFSQHRFSIYFVQSEYHNCPTINGVQQGSGSRHQASQVSFTSLANNQSITIRGEISKAYPKEALVKSWIRTIKFMRRSSVVQVEDKFQLEKFVKPQQLNFVMPSWIKLYKNKDGILLQGDEAQVMMGFDWKIFTIKIEEKSLDNDSKLTDIWGASVKRIYLVTVDRFRSLTGTFTVTFSPAK